MNKDVRKTAAILGIIAFIFFGFAFSLEPLYNALWRTTGHNGKVNLKQTNKIHKNVS